MSAAHNESPKPLQLAHDVLQLGTRRSPWRKFKRALRSLWRFLSEPAPW